MKPLQHINLYNPQYGEDCLEQGLELGIIEAIHVVFDSFHYWIEKNVFLSLIEHILNT